MSPAYINALALANAPIPLCRRRHRPRGPAELQMGRDQGLSSPQGLRPTNREIDLLPLPVLCGTSFAKSRRIFAGSED